MKVLMFGWEFPPFISGGLGTACYGLTKGLCDKGVEVTFVLPKSKGEADVKSHVNMLIANQIGPDGKKIIDGSVTFHEVDSILRGYLNSEEYMKEWYRLKKEGKTVDSGSSDDSSATYGKNLYEEVFRFAQKANSIADSQNYDVIHAHDWLTYKAGIIAKERTGKPLVLHIHNTVFDRYGDNPNQLEYDIEREGFHKSDLILAVSEWTRQKVINHYGIHPDKVKVVHNAVEFGDEDISNEKYMITEHDKVILSLGRITHQKGLMHLVWAARKAMDVEPNIKLVIGGKGDMEPQLIEEINNLGMAENVVFTEWLTGKDIQRAYNMADLFVMPSISEPFGIMPLECMRTKTPVLISKQSGVSEVVNHCLKVDFWDIDQMANKMVSVLRYPELHAELSEGGCYEVNNIKWDGSAEKCIEAYNCVLNRC